MKKLFLPILLFTSIMCGCTHVPPGESAHDPYESTNRKVFAFNDTLDKYFLIPAAKGYKTIAPNRVRMCVSNFFDNIFYPNTIVNCFLQGKMKQGAADTGRFLINSTVGLFGFFDPATELGLQKHHEDLGQTLAVWGFGEGPFLTLPGMGPKTTRETPDIITGNYLTPLSYLETGYYLPLKMLEIISWRANMLEATEMMNKSSIDRYLSLREFYRQNRIKMVHDGNPPKPDIFLDEEELFEEDDL